MRYFILFFLILLLFLHPFCGKDKIKINDYFGQLPPGDVPVKFAPGIVSTDSTNEYGGHFSSDGKEFFFTRNNPGRIMYSMYKNGEWTLPEQIFSNSDFNCSQTCISKDGSLLYFTASNFKAGVSEANLEHDIYVSERKTGIWGKPHPLTTTDLGKRRVCPSVAANGNLYYSGNLHNTDDKDIYVSRYVNGEYSEPENLGAPVNSETFEQHVHIAPDESYIVFDSYRPGGVGKSDLYVCFKKTDGSWTDASNLGQSINTKDYDWFPRVTADGKYLLFSRTAEGKIDIYWVSASIIKDLRKTLDL